MYHQSHPPAFRATSVRHVLPTPRRATAEPLGRRQPGQILMRAMARAASRSFPLRHPGRAWA